MGKKTDALSTKSGKISRVLAVFVSVVLVVGLMPGLQSTQSAYAAPADGTAETSVQDVDAFNDEAVSEDEPATEAVGQSGDLYNAVQTDEAHQDFESSDQFDNFGFDFDAESAFQVDNSEFDPELLAEADELGVDPALAAEAVNALTESDNALYVAEDGTAFAAAPDGTLLAGDEARTAAEQTEADKAGGLTTLDVDAQAQEHDAALEAIGDISGSGTESDPYLITTPDDLRTVGALINTDSSYANACMTLQNSIDLSTDANTATWTPIGTESLKYSGTFDGGGYTISGLNVVSTSAWYQGLFGFINGATLENFTVAGSVVGTTYLGGVVGDAWGSSTFRNITNNATVTSTGSSYAPTMGGIAGYARYSTFENCLNTAKITSDYLSTTTGTLAGYHAVGGITGTAYLASSETTTNTTTIARCANTGDIITSLSKQGGLVGESYNQYGLTMTDCYNTGYVGVTNDITVSSYSLSVGGLIGYSNYTGSAYLEEFGMSNCYNAGTLMSNASSAIYVGGLVGRVSGTRPTANYLPLVSNNYCLDSTATYMFGASSSSYAAGEIEGKAEFKSESEMKDASFAETLGSNWMAGTTNPTINNGWPYLRWQDIASTYDININVTLKNENNNDDANPIELLLTDATGKNVNPTPNADNSATSATWTLPAVADGMTYNYEITKKGYTTQSGTITVNKSSVDLDIVLEPVAYSQTLIVSPADADVVLTKNGSTTVTAASTTTDSTADTCTYVYEGLYNNDALSYKVTRYGYTSQEGDLDSLSYADGSATITLVAETSYTAEFNVSTPSAYAGATPWLQVYSNNAGDYYNQVIYDSKNDSAVTNANGVYTYAVSSLDDGTYTYHAYAQGLPSESGTFTISGASVTQEVTIAATDEAWDGTSVDISWYLYDTSADEFYIGSPAQLAGLSALCGFTATDFSGNEVSAPTFSGKTIYLTDDIDLGGRPWTPIGYYTSGSSASHFVGVFDGNNHTIANMYVGTGSGTLIHSGYNFGHGLFSELAGTSSSHSCVRNLTFKDSIVDSVNDTVGVTGSGAGMVTGYATYADVSNVSVEGGSVTHTNYVGGIVGQAYQSSDVVIEDCTNTATVTVTRYTGGGICGYLGTGAIVERCSNGGTVTSTNTSSSYVTTTTYGLGGVVGAASYQSLGVTDSCNTGDVSGCITNVAGIVGCAGSTSSYSIKYTISNCYNTGKITNTASSYSFTNPNGATASGIVGMLGSVSTSSTNVLENCYNVGDVSFEGTDDINTGSSPNYYVGQIVGQVYNATEANTTFLSNSYYPGDDGSAIKAIGRIKSTSGVVNIDLPDYDFMYKADAEMKTEEFVSILGNSYTMDIGNHNEGYPILGWQDTDMNWAVDVTISLDTSVNDDYVISKGSDGKYQVTTEGTRPSLTVYDANDTPVDATDDIAIVVDPDTGTYNFQAAYNLPDGTYTYEVSKEGYAAQNGTSPLTGSFTVSRGAVDLSLELTAVKYTFTLNVYDQSNDSTVDKTPIDDATVVLASGGSGGERIEPISAADGVWTYELYNGSYWLQVSKYGYTESTTPENELIKIAYDDADQEILLYRLNDYTLTITATPEEGQFQDSEASLSLSCDTKTWDIQTLTADDTGTVTFENVVAEGTYTYEVSAGGFNKETGIVEVAGDTTVPLTLSAVEPWDGSDIDISFYDPDKTSFDITSPAELAGVAAITNGTATDAGGVTIQDSFANKTVNLRANIDLGNNDWTPIGVYSGMSIVPFSGTFNGNGHVVSGLHCDLTVTGYYAVGGLFGATTDATITGVEVRGDILGKPNTSFVEAAGLVAASTGTLTISECGSEVTINELDMSDMPASTSVAHVASLVGWTRGTTTITSCYSRGTIAVTATASAFVAGLVAYCSATTGITMDACYNTCNMTVTYPEGAMNANAGGFIAAPGSCTVAITDSYNAGNVSATYRDAAQSDIECQGALIGNAANANSAGKIMDTYWLDTSCSKAIGDSFRGVNYSSSKTEDYMKSSDFVDVLNEAATEVGTTPFVASSFGSWPLLVWERDLVNVEMISDPDKIVYNDQDNFVSDGIQLELTYSSGDPQIITGGWTVIDGRNLAVGQTSVTIEYMGFSWSIDITVNQVEHPTAGNISLEVAGPVSGATPADEVTITSEPLSNGYITYSASVVRWTQAGQTFTGATFADATYYRAEIRIDTYYKDGDAWYVLPEDVQVSVAGIDGTPAPLEVLYAERAENGRSYTLVCTYTATTSATAGLTDKANHLYYEGDTHANSYNMPLAEDTALTLAIENENETIETTYSLADLEQRVLDENIGYENTYTNYVDGASTANTYTGLKLYQFLSGEFPAIYADTTEVTFVATDGTTFETTIGDLRQPGRAYVDADDGSDTVTESDVPWLLAYGRDGSPLLSYTELLSDATGPLMIISGQNNATTAAPCTYNVCRIELTKVTLADTQPVTFEATCGGEQITDLNITVTDVFGNVTYVTGDTCDLISDESYTYSVGADGYTTVQGTINVENEPITVNVDLVKVYSGNPSEVEPGDDGYYEIYNADQLVWWINNASRYDSVRLMDDVALNDGVTFDKDLSYSWPVEKFGVYDGSFAGIFDGNGHTIYGFYIYRENKIELWENWDGSVGMISDNVPYIGLFGYANGATVKNLGVDGRIDVLDRPDSQYASYMNIGGIFGYGYNVTAENCTTNIGINYTPATGSGTVGGYPYDGWPEVCDTYIGGIIGSGSGATVTDCYSRGEAVAGATRSSNVAGIAGRAANGTVVENCYSTMTIAGTPYSGSSFTSYQGGITGRVEDNTGGNTSVSSSVALNPSIDGGDAELSQAHYISGATVTLEKCKALDTITIKNATIADPSLNGDPISEAATTAKSTYTDIGWEDSTGVADATSGWQFETDAHPRLWWEDLSVSQTPDQLSDTVEVGETKEGSGGFSSSAPPQTFTLNIQVGGHDVCAGKVYTSTELHGLAHTDKVKYSCYTNGGYTPYGRVTNEYIPFDELFENAGVDFGAGDTLVFGGVTFSYENYFETPRYYYPNWDSWSDAGDVDTVPTALVMKSYGGSMYGSGDAYLDMYASQTDYLYAYMICFGMSSINDAEGNLFINQQTEATVSLSADSSAEDIVKDLLADAIARAEADRDSVVVGDDPADVGVGTTFVSEEVMEAFRQAIDAANIVMSDDNATNDDVMTAIEDLEAAIAAFDAAKQVGTKAVDFSALETAIKLGNDWIDEVTNGQIVVRDTDAGLAPGTKWVPTDVYDRLQTALEQAEAMYGDSYLTQAQVDEMTANLIAIDQAFEDAIATVAGYSVTIEQSDGGTLAVDKSENIAENETVTITATPTNADYELGEITVVGRTSGDTYTATRVEGTDNFTFAMPAENVTISATWNEVTPEPTPEPENHTIKIEQPEHATVSADKTEAAAGDDVTVTVTPEDGYEVDDVVIKDASGNNVAYTDNGNGTYTFKMPDSDVSVEVSVSHVAPTTIEKPMFDVDTSYGIYDGVNPVTKTIVGNNDGTPLVEGVDYTVTYKNNDKAGEATITITGIGDYTGTLEYTFRVIHYFEDVGATKDDVNEWYFDAVYGMVDLGAITGYNETIFGVGNSMTRAELVTIMWRYCEPDEYAAYDEPNAKDTTGLPDAADGMYYTGAVNWAYASGVITGNLHEDGTYTLNADDPVTFDQLVTILARYCLGSFDKAADYPQTALNSGSFTDRDAVEDWAAGSMSWAIENEVVTGNDNHNGTWTLSPLEDVARERATTVLYRTIENGLLKQG